MFKVLRVIDFSKASNYRLIAHMSNKMLSSSDRNERAEGQKNERDFREERLLLWRL